MSQRTPSGWRWRTFPVFAAFCAGLLVASFINGQPNNVVAGILQILALLGVSYCVIHIIVMRTIVSRRRRARPGGTDAGAEYEDVVVHPDDAPDR